MRFALALLSITSLATLAAADDELDAAFTRDVLIIQANKHACYRFDIYLALNFEQQRRGLMHVRNLPATTGMLFVYDNDGRRSMWMKNTFIPLDIAFAKSDGTIVNVERHTEPLSLMSIRSIEPASYVLEVNAGVTEPLHIDAGSRLLWGPVFGL